MASNNGAYGNPNAPQTGYQSYPGQSPLVANGIGGAIGQLFGGQNQFQSQTAGPNAAAYQNQDYGNVAQLLANQTGDNGQSFSQAVNRNAYVATNHANAAQINMANNQQDRGQQMQLAGQLAQTAAGQGPSVASQQLQQGLQQQLMGQASLAASQRGGGANPFLAQQAYAQQAAQAMQATNAQAAQQRASEQLNAQNSLGNVLQGVAGQDANLATSQAGLQQQTNLANLQAAQMASAQNAQNQLAALQMQQQGQQFQAAQLNGMDQQSVANQIQYQQNALQNAQYNNSLNANIAAQNAGQAGQLGNQIFGGLASAASGALAASDERVKTAIDRDRLSADMDEFLDTLDPASWDYKQPERFGQGRHYGVMAQSTERSRAGRSFTLDAPDGTKMLDTRKATGVALAALAHLHRRQEKVERSLAERALGDE